MFRFIKRLWCKHEKATYQYTIDDTGTMFTFARYECDNCGYKFTDIINRR